MVFPYGKLSLLTDSKHRAVEQTRHFGIVSICLAVSFTLTMLLQKHFNYKLRRGIGFRADSGMEAESFQYDNS